MQKKCGPGCQCRADLNAAGAALAEASKLLSQSVMSDSDELIETYYAFFRAAKAKFCGARAAHRDHLAEATSGAGLAA